MKTFFTLLLTVLLPMTSAIASKSNPHIDDAFKAYKEKKEILLKEGVKKYKTLKGLLGAEKYTISQALQTLTIVQKNLNKKDLAALNDLLEKHRKLTFKQTHPEHWRYIRAKDYHSLLCDEIENVIQSIREKEKE